MSIIIDHKTIKLRLYKFLKIKNKKDFLNLGLMEN